MITKSSNRFRRWQVTLIAAASLLGLVFLPAAASAFSGGVDGYSGNPATNGGQSCSQCHDGGTTPTVSIAGPEAVTAGETNTYTLTITGAQTGSNPRGALNVSADAGTLGSIAGQETGLSSGEITSPSPKEFAGGSSISWDFEWTAPAAGSATLYGAGLSADGASASGDGSDTVELAITVSPAAGSTDGVGEEIYATQCAGCHGSAGEGGAAGPSLQTSTMNLEDAVAVIADGAGGMPGYSSTLTEDEIEAVAGFSIGLQSPPDTTTTTTIPDTGSALYVAWCSVCHGDNAEGGIGPALAGIDIPLAEFAEITRTGAGAFHGFEGTLTDGEIELLATYLGDLDITGPPGDTLADITDPATLFTLGCAACHGVDGVGGIGSAVAGTTLEVGELIAVISEGTQGMPPFDASLDSEQIETLAEFVAGLGGDGPSTTTTTTTGTPTGPTPTPRSDQNSAAGLLVLVFGVLGGVTGGLILWRRYRQIPAPDEVEPKEYPPDEDEPKEYDE